jgi:dUTP pyrophosphatase
MKVKIKLLNPNAKVPFQKHSTDGAYDLVATSYELKDGLHIYGLGFATEIPEGYRVNIVPRSSFTNTHCVMQNAHAIIDADYRGEWSLKFRDLRWYNYFSEKDVIKNKPFQIGDRIAQCYIEKITPIEWEETEELSETERGTGGYGSTGLK